MSATTRREARAGAEKLLWYITSNKVPPHFANPPGYVPVRDERRRCCAAREHPLSAIRTKQRTVEGAIEAGIMFAGTPDQVLQADQEALTTMSAASAIC